MSAKILVLNGSLGGATGNTAQALAALLPHLSGYQVDILNLCELRHEPTQVTKLSDQIREAQGFIFATGTYWDSWGSPLQLFLEETTYLEGSEAWLGKPALCLVTMHAIGGKGVLSRLQGVLSTLGLMIPPMSGMVYSMTGHSMLKSVDHDASFDEDIWCFDDFEKMSQNFRVALDAFQSGNLNFISWPVDHRDPTRLWLK